MQLSYGQRPAGSPQLQALARRLRVRLPEGHFEPLPGQPGLRNVVGTIPGKRPGIVIGAHYDTLADPKGFVGANNGAAGTAIVVEAARALSRMKLRPGREIRFVLFDGEEPPSGLPEDSPDFEHSGLRGSRAYVTEHPRRTAAMILLDYVGNKGLSLPREANSDPGLWLQLRGAARSVGALSVFPAGTGMSYLDDHTPFLRAGVRAIDLIDPNYEGHSVSDRIDKLSRRSMNAVGETIVALAQALR
jgi:Zn-dependent M28 family amino/carboxypeptidase